MLRQRIRTRRFAVVELLLGAVAVLIGLGLLWYGAMTVLLALKVSPHMVDDISAYRTVYDRLAGLTAGEVTGDVRIVVALAGLVCLAIFGALAHKGLPRPYLARGELDVTKDDGERGRTIVYARAIERVGELAALDHPQVTGAGARYGTDDLIVLVDLSRADALAQTLAAVQLRVRDALAEHELPPLPVDVTLTAIDRSNRRELV
ncbi:MAG: hypothetical protein ACYCX7_02735 [Solirubrobacteraceae bacterium]